MLIILLQFNLSNSVRFRERFEEWFHRGSLVMALLAASFRNAGCREHPTFHSILPPTPSPSQGLPLGTPSHRWSWQRGNSGRTGVYRSINSVDTCTPWKSLKCEFYFQELLGVWEPIALREGFLFPLFLQTQANTGGKKILHRGPECAVRLNMSNIAKWSSLSLGGLVF